MELDGEREKRQTSLSFSPRFQFFSKGADTFECLSFMVMVYESFGGKNGPITLHSDETHVTWDEYVSLDVK